MRANKYNYYFVVQGYYGSAWEDLTQSEIRSEALANLRDYRENDPAPIRMIERRELSEAGIAELAAKQAKRSEAFETYKIVRMYQRDGKRSRTIARGLSLAEAQDHCRDLETSSKTAIGRGAREHTAKHGSWFDGYESERGKRS